MKINHSVYNITYHIVFCPKYKPHIFKNELEDSILKSFNIIAYKYNFKVLKQEIMPDYIHLFISAPPTIAPTKIVKIIKNVSTNEIFKTFPKLQKNKFWGSGIWSKGYYICTSGIFNYEIIEKYIHYSNLK